MVQIIIIIYQFTQSLELLITVRLFQLAFLRKYSVNVICVDWSYFAKRSYYEAIENTWFVGVFLGKFIQWLVYETGLGFENIHLIGHSLGSHVAGVAGSQIKFGFIEKITGL